MGPSGDHGPGKKVGAETDMRCVIRASTIFFIFFS
jgi:hypothetical protein